MLVLASANLHGWLNSTNVLLKVINVIAISWFRTHFYCERGDRNNSESTKCVRYTKSKSSYVSN